MKQTLLALAISSALLLPGISMAQQDTDENQPAAEEVTELSDITVTARRRAEDINRVPVAVSAFGASDLDDLQADRIDGLQGAVPNLNIVQGRGSSANVNIFIRGIGQPDALQTFDPGVGFYVDDVYYSRINGSLLGLFDIDSIEVLRGPQGTLYGKNSTGGAIKVNTRRPDQMSGGAVELTVGDYGRFNANAYLGGAFSPDLSGSIAVASFNNDGYVRDPVTGRRFNDDDTQSARAKLAWHPGGIFSAMLSMDYTRQDTSLTMGRPTAPLYNADLLTGFVDFRVLPESDTWDYRSRTSFNPDQGQKLTHKGVSLHMDWELDPVWTLKSISAYRRLDTEAFIDIDASEMQLGDVLVALDQKQFSQELQLQYDNGSNLQAVFGLYYLDESVPSYQEAYADDFLSFAGFPVDFLRTIEDDLDTESYAAFGHFNWALDDTWSLAAGLRYTSEEKTYFRTTSAYFGAPLEVASEDPQAVIPRTSTTWSALTPSLSLQNQLSDRTMVYLSANRGFKSGGYNGRANSPDEAANPIFDPEFVWTYELGMKTRTSDGRGRMAMNVFHSIYRDFQARVSAINNPNDPIPEFSFPVLNAAKLTMNGAEFEGSWLLGDATRLQAQLGYLDAKYDRFDDPRTLIDPTLASLHDHVPFSPKWNARLAATHTFSLANGTGLTLGGDVAWRDDTWLSVDNRPGLMQKSYALLGLFGSLDTADGRWQLRAGVRNLTDETYRVDAQEFSSVGNIQTVFYGWPRNFYLSARYNFF